MTVSRIKDKADHIFECYLHLERLGGSKPKVTYKYPENFNNQDILDNVPVFCFPIETLEAGKYFSFTITNCMESMFSFGYCKVTTPTSCICVVSYLPWHDFFHRFVVMVEKIQNVSQYKFNSNQIVGSLYRQPIPAPGPFTFDAGSMKCNMIVPDHRGLVTLSESRALHVLLGTLNTRCIYTLYMALMMERRIILTSQSLETLSSAVYAARDLIYPLYWQHVFIPVLPESLIDYVAAPMPLLVGLHKSLEDRARKIWGDELVLVDLDNDEMQVPPSLLNEDMLKIPHGIEESVMEGIKGIKKMYEHDEMRPRIGNKIAKMFCVTLVAMVGNYRGSCRFDNTHSKTFSFDHEHFLQSRPSNMQEVVQKLLQCQHFDEFIQERLKIIQGVKTRDAYEDLSVNYYQTGSHKNYLKTWINDEISKEWNPQLAMIQNGAFAFQGLISDMNSGSKVSSPKLTQARDSPASRTAPAKPLAWHLYRNRLTNLPAFFTDSTARPPTIDDKLFNLLIGNLDHISSNPSIKSAPNIVHAELPRSASLARRPPTSRPPRPVSSYIPRTLPPAPGDNLRSPGEPCNPHPSHRVDSNASSYHSSRSSLDLLPQSSPSSQRSGRLAGSDSPGSAQEVNVGQLISLDDST